MPASTFIFFGSPKKTKQKKATPMPPPDDEAVRSLTLRGYLTRSQNLPCGLRTFLALSSNIRSASAVAKGDGLQAYSFKLLAVSYPVGRSRNGRGSRRNKRGMFERLWKQSRVLRARLEALERREPEGQGGRAPFSAYSFVAQQKSKVACGAATPRPFSSIIKNQNKTGGGKGGVTRELTALSL